MSLIKNIVVCLNKDDISEYDIDTETFDDPYLEAITRAIEKGARSSKVIRVRPLSICWEKSNPKKQTSCNSYLAMVNASLYKKAELLREKYKIQYDIDLAKRPMYGNPEK